MAKVIDKSSKIIDGHRFNYHEAYTVRKYANAAARALRKKGYRVRVQHKTNRGYIVYKWWGKR